MAYTQTDGLLALSYALGESSVPTSGIEDRKAFLQRTLEEIYQYGDWDWNKTTATVALSAGIATLPSQFAQEGKLDIRLKQDGTDHVFTKVPYEEQDRYSDGDYRYWLTGLDGAITLNTSETSDSSSVLTVFGDQVVPSVNASITTPFPRLQTWAQGALRYYRAARDPEYDISQDQAIFEKGLNDLIAQQTRNKATRVVRTRQSVNGSYTGMI